MASNSVSANPPRSTQLDPTAVNSPPPLNSDQKQKILEPLSNLAASQIGPNVAMQIRDDYLACMNDPKNDEGMPAIVTAGVIAGAFIGGSAGGPPGAVGGAIVGALAAAWARDDSLSKYCGKP